MTKSGRGQSLVEFAVTLPVMFALLLGIVEGGRLVYTMTTLDSAVQEGARYAALQSTGSSTAVQDYVVNNAFMLNLSAGAVTLQVNGGAKAYTARISGDRVTVSTSYSYQPLITSIFGANLSLTLNARSDVGAE